MVTQRTLIIELSIIAILLMVLMTVLLFQQSQTEPEQDRTEVTNAVSEPQPSISTMTEATQPVSQEEEREVPLGTDINMEFPTLDE